jgi:DNA modification methylase
MKTIHASDIIVPDNRQRRHFDEEALRELSTDIQANGLLHPIILRGDGRTLVAGERRFRAITTYLYPLGRRFTHDGEIVPSESIPFTRLADLSPLQVMEAEYAENAVRADLTWQEKAEAQARLHSLRVAQNPVHTVADTAQEIHGRSDGDYQTTTKVNLILAQHLDNPVVAKAKTAKDAFKALVRQESDAKHSAMATAVGKTFSASKHQAIHADCISWMKDCPPETFDVILTDPPYGMGADKFGDGAGRLANIEHLYDDSYENWRFLMAGNEGSGMIVPGWCELSYQVAKPQAHAYVFCDFDRFHELKGFMQAAGWYVFRTPFINVKDSGRVPLPDQGPRRQYEICLYAIKGQKHTTGIFSDVLHSVADEQMGHGAQKPVSLYIELLRRSARPGDAILDSFAGSGTIFPACQELKLRAVGIEQVASSYGKCLERLNLLIAAEAAEPELFT